VGLVLVACGITFGLLVIAACHPDSSRGDVVRYILIGLALGTIWAHGTLAAAWAALGPFALWCRLPASLAWLLAVACAFGLNLAQGPGDHELGAIMAVCLAGQWLVVQVPLWGLGVYYGLRLDDSPEAADAPRLRQFGIRQLMLVTAAVGVIFGIGRAVVPWVARQMGGGEVPIFIFLAIAAIVFTLPLLLAVLLPRYSLVATLAVGSLIAAATLTELPLLAQITGRAGGGGPDIGHLVAINTVQAVWIVGIAALLRLSGYSLTTSRTGAGS
jgi:hypothetical protein